MNNRTYKEELEERCRIRKQYREDFHRAMVEARERNNAEKERRHRISSAINAASERMRYTKDPSEQERLKSEIAILSSQLR